MDLPIDRIKDVFSFINYEDDGHIYFNGDSKYTSVTTLISQYKNSIFDESFKKDYALKYNLPNEQYVDTLWQIKREYGALKGTEIHFYIETYLNYGIKNQTVCGVNTPIKYFHNFWNEFNSRCKVIGTEIIIADQEFEIAGTLDCLIKIDNHYYIIDWKTNKEITTNSDINFKDPINHLVQSDINTYSLQLSIYKYILEKYLNINTSQLVLVHLTKNEDNYKIYTLEYKYNEIINLMKDNLKCGK